MMETAHGLGMKTTATMMFGHVETLEERDGARLGADAREADLANARRWFTSFGSCSISEPLEDLISLGLVSTGSTTEGNR